MVSDRGFKGGKNGINSESSRTHRIGRTHGACEFHNNRKYCKRVQNKEKKKSEFQIQSSEKMRNIRNHRTKKTNHRSEFRLGE